MNDVNPGFSQGLRSDYASGSCRIAATCYDRYVLKATRARRRVLHSFGEGGSLRRAAWAKFLYALARISLFRFTLTQFVICHLSSGFPGYSVRNTVAAATWPPSAGIT
jgi:hypothetical protein